MFFAGTLCPKGTMAQRMNMDHFVQHYPPEVANKCFEAAMYVQKECEYTSRMQRQHFQMEQQLRGDNWDERSFKSSFGFNRSRQPPSWADVGSQRQNGQHQFGQKPPQFQPPSRLQPFTSQQFNQPPQFGTLGDGGDVFSSMGHWASDASGRSNRSNHPSYQPQRSQKDFCQPSPPTPLTDVDVFENCGEWDVKKVLAPKVVQMPVDPFGLTPPPTFQPYPPRDHSLESPNGSMTSSSEIPEKNSWNAFNVLLNNQKSTRSPSLDSNGTKSPAELAGPWISNLS
ncbi:unnamed protein product [Caenorhabditis sp. 36 PRJEB53466]|nr:unnamed protein product [Caenorhabditis sp. 36 PRJEB53466]